MMKNVLLLAMSTLPNPVKDNFYQYQDKDGDNKPVSGQSQLEPVTRMLCEERKKHGEKLDKIIILETKETVKPHADGRSAVKFYKERVEQLVGRDTFEDIDIDEDNPAEGIKNATSFILHYHEEQKKNNDGMRLWIDTQGGLRDVVMVFNAIISLLREQGIEPEGIYSVKYSSKNTESAPCPIIDQTEKYGIFKFVSAMQEFMDFGKATGLKRYCGEGNRFVELIGNIADAIQMCQPQKFEESIKEFAGYLKSGQYEAVDPYLQIFVEFMKSDYGILLEQPDNTIEQIKWCVRKEFYQQAMTIYIENMPRYYYENMPVYYSGNGVDVEPDGKPNRGKNSYAEAFYTDLFDKLSNDDAEMAAEKELDKEFRKILDDAHEKEQVRKGRGARGCLQKWKGNKGLSAGVSRAVASLIGELDKKYDETGKRKADGGIGPGTILKYINHINSDSDAERYRLIHGKKREKPETYEKKVIAIKRAKETNPELAEKMKYYFAVKLLRNRMNHASEAEVEGDEEKAVKFLEGENIEIGIENEKIKKILTDGVKCAE